MSWHFSGQRLDDIILVLQQNRLWWACVAKRRQWLGEEMYAVWSGGFRPRDIQKKTWTGRMLWIV